MERNIFGISLEQRQADLEALPWVRRATVMRLLPGRLRVSLVERTPVAFVRQGGKIGLVDAQGVLLDMNPGAEAEHFSFPVVTGIMAGDPVSTRAARMRIFARFMAELDAAGAKNSESLSEIDLSNPEDVKALVEEHGATVMVHFGDAQFLERFNKVKELLPQWHAQYPNLASADMRYEHEIPLAMAGPAKAALPLKGAPKPGAAAPTAHAAVSAKAASKSSAKPAPHVAVKTATPPLAKAFEPAPAAKPWQPTAPAVQPAASGAPSVSAAARSAFVAKVPVTAPKPPLAPPARHLATTTAKAQAAHPALSVAATKHTSGKPAAGKPLDTPHPSQAVQP